MLHLDLHTACSVAFQDLAIPPPFESGTLKCLMQWNSVADLLNELMGTDLNWHAQPAGFLPVGVPVRFTVLLHPSWALREQESSSMCRICLCFYPAVCMRGHGDRQCINSLLPCLFLVVMGSFFFKWDFLFNKLWDITATSQTTDCRLHHTDGNA